MKGINKSLTWGLSAAGLAVICSVQTGLAGYKSALSTSGVGQVQSSLAYSGATSDAVTPDNYTKPSAGVTKVGTWTAVVPQPTGTPNACTSTVSTVFLTGGYKAIARSYIVTGVTADNPELRKKLADEQFSLAPALCGASYNIASGDEFIDGKRYLVVLGQATGGTAAWFRGYYFNGTPSGRDDILQNGIKLYEMLLKGPFDFGDIESTDRCKAMKLPIDYDGPNLYLISDGLAESTTDLQFVNPPTTVSIGCSAPLAYPVLQTSGGCGLVSVTFDPPSSMLPLGTSVVTATATDSAGNLATCQFTVVRPSITFNGFYSPISGSGGICTVPIRYINAGNKIPIKFDTTLCGAPYKSTVPPNVTITKIDPISCAVIAEPVDHQYFQWVANQWHFNWNTLASDKGRYRIEVELGDGGTDPYAIVELK